MSNVYKARRRPPHRFKRLKRQLGSTNLGRTFHWGGFKSKSDIAQYIKEPPRLSTVPKCTRWFRIATYLPDHLPAPFSQLRRDSSFKFNLEYEYDGINLFGVRILPRKRGLALCTKINSKSPSTICNVPFRGLLR